MSTCRGVVFAGDGTSDLCPAREADYVFARDSLAKACTREGISFRPFNGFGEIQRFITDLANS